MVDDPGFLVRFWDHLIDRPSGPFAFRFVLQPVVASAFAILDGIKDAQAGRSPYFWLLVHDPANRYTRLKEGLSRVGRVIGLSVVMDIAYTLIEFHRVYPLETLAIALMLAFVPYLLVRGPANRISRTWQTHTTIHTAKK